MIVFVHHGQPVTAAEFRELVKLQPTESEVDAVLAENERVLRENPHKRRSQPQIPQIEEPAAMQIPEIYRREYAQHENIHAQLGVSLEDFAQERMIEEGLMAEPRVWPGAVVTQQAQPVPFAGVPGLIDTADPEWGD